MRQSKTGGIAAMGRDPYGDKSNYITERFAQQSMGRTKILWFAVPAGRYGRTGRYGRCSPDQLHGQDDHKPICDHLGAHLIQLGKPRKASPQLAGSVDGCFLAGLRRNGGRRSSRVVGGAERPGS